MERRISSDDQRRRAQLVNADLHAQLDPGTRALRHVGLIMDGNGRWAERRGLDRSRGHQAAEDAICAAVDEALRQQIEYLTLYTFSTENWKRPKAEVAFLMWLVEDLIGRLGPRYHAQGVRMRFLGSPSKRVPRSLRKAIKNVETLTGNNEAMTLTFAFNYGGRGEIIQAIKSIVVDGVPAEQIDEQMLGEHLQYPDMPDVDLIVRTGGEYRLSNFLTWLSPYAELMFIETLWPDFREEDLRAAVEVYRTRDRRFGGLNPDPTTLSETQ